MAEVERLVHGSGLPCRVSIAQLPMIASFLLSNDSLNFCMLGNSCKTRIVTILQDVPLFNKKQMEMQRIEPLWRLSGTHPDIISMLLLCLAFA